MSTIERITSGGDWTATTLSGTAADVLTLASVIIVAYLVVMAGVALVFSWSWLHNRRTSGPARHRRERVVTGPAAAAPFVIPRLAASLPRSGRVRWPRPAATRRSAP